MADKDNTDKAEMSLEAYTDLILKVDEANDKIKEMEALTKELKVTAAHAKPKERFTFGALFRDENDINEKAIIGFASFLLMVTFGIADLVTAFWDMDLKVSDTIYTSFVVVTLGSFGISEAGKAFSKQ